MVVVHTSKGAPWAGHCWNEKRGWDSARKKLFIAEHHRTARKYLMDTSNSPGDSCLPLGERTQKVSCITRYWSAIQTQAHNTACGRQTANTQRYDFLHISRRVACSSPPSLDLRLTCVSYVNECTVFERRCCGCQGRAS